jgi:hypothetical protein
VQACEQCTTSTLSQSLLRRSDRFANSARIRRLASPRLASSGVSLLWTQSACAVVTGPIRHVCLGDKQPPKPRGTASIPCAAHHTQRHGTATRPPALCGTHSPPHFLSLSHSGHCGLNVCGRAVGLTFAGGLCATFAISPLPPSAPPTPFPERQASLAIGISSGSGR